ncbi:hypothetical protein EDWATA_00680 [Edwardsiella tarda ATCC 23685]|uniref:Uncharacterized protein n=1 Tax=Edwardsiella tarda ATCC 23685 TaxID=500638 RepID=D4F1T6_EDWTA|nr:hypothetical protein EDWATA_00680 [Edwardsiella tarda ATCC 23685]
MCRPTSRSTPKNSNKPVKALCTGKPRAVYTDNQTKKQNEIMSIPRSPASRGR